MQLFLFLAVIFIKNMFKKNFFSAPKNGLNLRDLPSLLRTDSCTRLQNFFYEGEGVLRKRKGMKKLFEVINENQKILLLEKYLNKFVIAYGTNLVFYDPETETFETIKSDFTSSENFCGVEYGGFFYITNGEDKIGVIGRKLNFINLVLDSFHQNEVIIGSTSGATARIVSADNFTSGPLILSNIEGEFISGETITDVSGASATVDGSLYFYYQEIEDAPIAKTIFVHELRLFAGNTKLDPSEIIWSKKDNSNGVPFVNWDDSTDSNAYGGAGRRSNRVFGTLKSFGVINDQIVAFYDQGRNGFKFKVLNIDGYGLYEYTEGIFQSGDFGGQVASATPAGIFYVNQYGVFLQAKNQQECVSLSLGDNYFSEIDFSKADMIYLPLKNRLLITCARDSEINNLVLCYDLENKAWSEISGWNISKFLLSNAVLYGGGIFSTTVYQLFEGNDDDGNDIWCALETGEISFGDETMLKKSRDFYLKGRLAFDSSVSVSLDIWDQKNNLTLDKLSFAWQADNLGSGDLLGTGELAFGENSAVESNNLIESFAHSRVHLNNYLKTKIKITEHSMLPLEINFIALDFENKKQVRKRNLLFL